MFYRNNDHNENESHKISIIYNWVVLYSWAENKYIENKKYEDFEQIYL